jgi:Zn-dependent peptidase ImmA (M78 family)
LISLQNLKDVRVNLLGYRRETAANLSHLSVERIESIEDRGEVPTIYEVDALSRIYGIDADRLAEEPIRLEPGDAVETLASKGEFQGFNDTTKSRIVAVANAARDLTNLRALEGNEDLRNSFKRKNAKFILRKGCRPFQQGKDYAVKLRQALNLGRKPIPSVRDFVAEKFQDVTVLYANLGRTGPAGLSFIDHLRGVTLALNLEGKNKNPCVRRFSLLHELCHLLLDWNRMEPLAAISGYSGSPNHDSLPIEQRANAFAVRFLCPETVIKGIDKNTDLSNSKLGRTLASYGLPWAALRLYLRNENDVVLPEIQLPELTETWTAAEEPSGIERFPLQEVPPERRTVLAKTAACLYSAGKIPRDHFAELLDVTPSKDLESVLDFFGVDVPSDGLIAASA